MAFNLMQLMGMLKNSNNPQALMMNMLSSQNNNPLMQNLLKLAQQGDTSAIEGIARNICREKGLDFDKEFTNFRNNLGL